MLELPSKIDVKDLAGDLHKDVDMWRFWQLEEGVLKVDPQLLSTNDGKVPPVIHVDTDAPLISDEDGSVITDKMWEFTTSRIGTLAVSRVVLRLTR